MEIEDDERIQTIGGTVVDDITRWTLESKENLSYISEIKNSGFRSVEKLIICLKWAKLKVKNLEIYGKIDSV